MTGKPPPLRLTRLDMVRSFLRILLPFTAFLLVVAAMHYYGYYATERGQVQTTRGLFSFTTVHPLNIALRAVRAGQDAPDRAPSTKPNEGTHWRIVSRVPRQVLASTPLLFVQRHAGLYSAMVMLIALGSWLLARAHLRHRQAEARSEYEQLFRRTLESIDLVAVSIDTAGRVSFCNDHFLSVTGWRRNDVVGNDWEKRFTPKNARHKIHNVIEGARQPELFPARREIPVLTRDGGTRLIAWNNTLSS